MLTFSLSLIHNLNKKKYIVAEQSQIIIWQRYIAFIEVSFWPWHLSTSLVFQCACSIWLLLIPNLVILRPLCLCVPDMKWSQPRCLYTALSPPRECWRRTNINARTKHLSVFSDSVKCKTWGEEREIWESEGEGLMARGKWREEGRERERQIRTGWGVFWGESLREVNWKVWWYTEERRCKVRDNLWRAVENDHERDMAGYQRSVLFVALTEWGWHYEVTRALGGKQLIPLYCCGSANP